MHHAGRVHRHEAFCEIERGADDDAEWHPSARSRGRARHRGGERLARDELHRDERLVFLEPEIEHTRNVRVGDSPRDAHFPTGRLEEVSTAEEELQRHAFTEQKVGRPKHLAGRAPTDAFIEPVALRDHVAYAP